jgi:hypothetical protein
VLCRRAEQQEISRSTPLYAHDDHVALSFFGDAQHFSPGLSVCHQRLYAAKLGRAGNDFLKALLEHVLTLFQEVPDRRPRVVLNTGGVLEFVRDDVENGELPVGFLCQRDRIVQGVDRRL